MAEPTAARPYMPGYGIEGPEGGTGLLRWSWAEERLVSSHDYWVATVWPDGRPHVMPVWGVWDGGGLWFSSAPGSRKIRNLSASPGVVVTTDDAKNPVVLDGVARLVDDAGGALFDRFTDLTNAKYGTDYSAGFYRSNALVRVAPVSAFGVAEGDFTGSPTRWTFGS